MQLLVFLLDLVEVNTSLSGAHFRGLLRYVPVDHFRPCLGGMVQGSRLELWFKGVGLSLQEARLKVPEGGRVMYTWA